MTQSTRLLLMALLMFPQIVETLYSPILPVLSSAFAVSEAAAGQTLSLYFMAFAFGIVLWGHLCDRLGRRITFIFALSVYAVGAVTALWVTDFSALLICRMVMALGAAIGSIGTQTVMRDAYSGEALRKTFAIVGILMAISPMLGIFMGTLLEMHLGYRAIFMALVLFALMLLLWTILSLPETRPHNMQRVALLPIARAMLKDGVLLRQMVMIAGFNLMLFSYYQLAPFWLTDLGYPMTLFSYTGLLLGAGSLLGALINRRCTQAHVPARTLIRIATMVLLISALMAFSLRHSLWLLLPMGIMTLSYGIAIPNILAHVLDDYHNARGTAGALLGLGYYLLLGLGLMLSAISGHLAGTLLVTALFMLCINLSE